MRVLNLFAMCMMMIAVSLGLASAAAPVPTIDEIQQDYDAQQYQSVIRKAAALMQPNASLPAGFDKARLLSLKAESHLRLKQSLPASDAFAAAAKESSDEKVAGLYKATAMLVRKSPSGQYQPKPPVTKSSDSKPPTKPEPIGIIEPDSRKRAFAALFDDEANGMAPTIESLKKQTSLPPLMSGIMQIIELRLLELAGTGSDVRSAQMLSSVTSHASDLMSSALDTMSTNVETIAKDANKVAARSSELTDGVTQKMRRNEA
jgi:hypothetical protein